MPTKLTKSQRFVLTTLIQPHVVSMSSYALGVPTRTMGVLLKDGLVEPEAPRKIVWSKHTLFHITAAGRLALSDSKENDRG